MITEVEGNKKKPFCALTIIGDCLLALNNFSSAIGNGERWTITKIKLCKNLNSQTVNNSPIYCFSHFKILFYIIQPSVQYSGVNWGQVRISPFSSAQKKSKSSLSAQLFIQRSEQKGALLEDPWERRRM